MADQVGKPEAQRARYWLYVFMFVSVVRCASSQAPAPALNPQTSDESDVVTITNNCGVFEPSRFVGRVVRRVVGGTLAPVPDVTITRSRDAGYLTADLVGRSYHTGPDGQFDIPVVVGVESVSTKDGDRVRETETVEVVTFTFEAPGCHTLQWPYYRDERSVLIELQCSPAGQGASGG